MSSLPIIVAHGQLGRYDEVIFLTVAAVFISIVGAAWVKSRNTAPEFDSDEQRAEDHHPQHFELD